MLDGIHVRLPNTAHTSRPWRVHELTSDFRLEAVWALPTPGDPSDFPRLVKWWASLDPSRDPSGVVSRLWAIREKVGAQLGWDSPNAGTDAGVLRERLPVDLREGASGPRFDSLPFESLYLLEDEWAAEVVNRTVHAILHLGWVPDGSGGYRGQMAIYVKPNGHLGTIYMAAIKPFRYLIVYPLMLRQMERDWLAQTGAPARSHS